MQKEDIQAEVYGDRQKTKNKSSLRVLLQNIQRLPLSIRDQKHEDIVDWIHRDAGDIAILTEINTYWPKVPAHQQWEERSERLFPQGLKSRFSYNKTEKASSNVQYGGVAALALGETRHRVCSTGEDSTGLGRWVWMRYKGKGGMHLRVVGAYRPNPKASGENTVYVQHQRYLLKQKDDRDSQLAFDQDFEKTLKTWSELGDHIVVAMDANDDLRNGPVKRLMARQGLREALLTRHHDKPTVATYNRNHDCKPIDGIFVTGGIKVTAGGYYAFDEALQSPHRALWLDIDSESVFGLKAAPLEKAEARRLKTTDPRVVKKYNKILEKELMRLKLPHRLFLLESNVKSGEITQEQAHEYEETHQPALQCKANAERKCRKLKMGGVDWSPEYKKARDQLEIWALLRKKKLGLKVSSRRIRRWICKTKVVNPWRRSLESIEQELTVARANYKDTKKKAAELRSEHNDRLYAAMAKDQGINAKQIKSNMNQIERLRKQARRVRRATKKYRTGGLSRVEVKENGQLKTYTSKGDIERVCGEENLQRFRGAYSRCPFLEEPLLSEFGTLGINDNSDAVLRGTYQTPEGTPKYISRYVDALRMPPEVKRRSLIPDRVTTSGHQAFWNKAIESKSSEPRGLHNGHYIAGAQSTLISEFDAALRHIPYHTGYAPTIWCNITDLAIEKEKDNFLAEKMRTIQLMSSEFNTNNKQLGRDMMKHGELSQVFPEEHGGSRKGRQAVEQVLNKRLALDITRQTRRSGALAGTDAKSCYDRMAHVPTSLSMQRLGVPKGPVASLFGVLQKSIHRIRTAYGDSEVRFVSDPSNPIQGIGQGNGCGPAGWIALSTPIMAMLRQLGFGFWTIAAITGILVYTMGFAFVDDIDLFHTGQYLQTGEDLIPEMQQAVNAWEQGITATGGSLVPGKSYWGLLDHKWDSQAAKWSLKTIEETPGDISIRKVESDDMEILRRVEPAEAVKTLGVMLNLEGTDKAEATYLRGKAEAWAENIRTGVLTKNDAWYALNTTVMKTMEYPMAAICLSKKQWDHVMAPVLEAGLNLLQFSRKFPRDMVYGPKKLQGLGVKDPYIGQGLTWIKTLLHHGGRETMTGALLRSSMEYLHLEVGTGSPFFQDNYEVWSDLVTDCWLKHVWQFQQEQSLRVDHTVPVVMKQTEHDAFLMPLFVKHGYLANDLRLLNQCRCFLQVLTVADVLVADGSKFCEDAMQGVRNDSRRLAYNWPRTERPANRHWVRWRQALRQILAVSLNRSSTWSLGKWHPSSAPQWNWRYDPGREELFHREGALWVLWLPKGRPGLRSTSRSYFKAHTVSSLPQNLQLVSVRRITQRQSAQVTGVASLATITVDDAHLTGFHERLQWFRKSNPHDAWILDELELVGDHTDVIRSIQDGTACAISDGSFKNQSGAAGFSIICPKTESSYTAKHTVQGPSTANSAYRSELSGILGILTLANLLCIHDGLHSGGVTLACDGLSALQQAFYDGPAVVTRPDFDLIHTIRHYLRVSQLKWTSQHVRGHQEDFKEWAELTWWEKQNVRMDHAAKDKMLRPWTAPSQRISSHEGWSVWRGNQKQTFYNHDGIYTLLCERRVVDYWLRRGRLAPEATDRIDWEVLAKACDEESPGRLRWVTKHVTGVCGVGKFLERWQFQPHSRCPRCDAPNEDNRHVYQCPARSTKLEWHGALDDIRQWCDSQDTSPAITEVILKCLKAWQAGRNLPPYRGRDALAHAYDAQRVIGWGCFLEGSLAREWKSVQDTYLQMIGSRKTGSVWARGLIRQLWKAAFRLWMHRNSWQHSDENPQHLRELVDLDHQITTAYALGTVAVRPEHQHIFNTSLGNRLCTPLLDKQKWVAFFDLARAKATAHHRRRIETQRRFRAWATSGLSSADSKPTGKPHPTNPRRAFTVGGKHKRDYGPDVLPQRHWKKSKRPIVPARMCGKRKRPPESEST
jgi:hypothetical protein